MADDDRLDGRPAGVSRLEAFVTKARRDLKEQRSVAGSGEPFDLKDYFGPTSMYHQEHLRASQNTPAGDSKNRDTGAVGLEDHGRGLGTNSKIKGAEGTSTNEKDVQAADIEHESYNESE